VEWAGSPADYAQFLVGWAGRPVAAATGVSGSGSDLFRRVKMLLEEKKACEPRCSRGWLAGVASGLVALGLLAGGLGLRAVAAEDKKAEDKKAEPKKAEPKKAEPKKAPRRNPLGRALPKLMDLDEVFRQFGGAGLDEDALKDLRKQMEDARRQIEELRKQMGQGGFQGFQAFPGGAFVLPGRQNPFAGRQPRLGAQVRRPSQTLVDQLELPKDQGVVLEEVGPNSAAAKAGLKSHDVLLELAGKPVPSKVEEFVKALDEIKPNTPVDAVVMRRGKKETIKGLTLPEAKAAATPAVPALPEVPALPGLQGGLGRLVGPGAFGRGMTSVSRVNDEFTTKHRDGGVTVTLKGTVQDGKAKVSEVVIDADGQKKTYDAVDKVPAEYKEKVQKLADLSAGRSGRFRVR
jgi:hypothetical protein